MTNTGTSDEVIIPRWQPDDELSACSICGNGFTFLNRRHHCRRCGRLVCGPCSPHRITIPRQYIVRPAEETASDHDGSGSRRRSDASLSDQLENPALGGGETVRVCNPCVPDPNYGPPPQQEEREPSPLPPTRSRAQTSVTEEGSTVGINFTRLFGSLNMNELSQATSHSAPHNARTLSDFGAAPPRQPEGRAAYRPQLHTARYQALNSMPQRPCAATQGLRTRSDNDANYLSRSRYRSTSGAASSLTTDQASQAQLQSQRVRAREVLSEEDECPVCGTRNHPFGTTGSSEERERHVEFCISSHLAGPSTTEATATTPVQAEAGEAETTAPATSVPQRASSMLGASTARQRMLVYHATEKDCFDEEGQAQECVICFEEFEEGVEMGRLECLCKFHRACIKGWWEKRGRGTCPTHQLHD